jgi:serine/threonine-protein kinase HipA
MIKELQSVSVMYHGRKVGTLSVGSKQICQFEYDRDWLADGFSISPLKLPLKSGIMTADYMPFNGNFGVFEDCLPGGYGEYLLRKVLSKAGINYGTLTPVQRLSLVGSSGMGALCYVPETQMQQSDWQGSFDEMQQMALEVLAEKTEDNADVLFYRSGNSGGVRPKCIYTDADGHWLVKFRHTYDPKNIGEIEFKYNQVARKCGITVPDFKLMDGKYFASRRFDIEDGQRLHVVTASGLLNEPITPPKMDYHSLLQLTGYLTQSPEEVEQQFRRMAFNVYARNYDDHARNFSFICRDGKWTLAPAYDLTNDNTLGEHATTVNFKGLPTDEDMIVVGTNIRITRSRCLEIIEEVRVGTEEIRGIMH